MRVSTTIKGNEERRGGRGGEGSWKGKGRPRPQKSRTPPLRSTLSEIKVNFLLLPRNGTERNERGNLPSTAARADTSQNDVHSQRNSSAEKFGSLKSDYKPIV